MSILYYFIDDETRKLRPEAAHKVVAQKDHNADVIRVGIPETMNSVDLETSAVRCMYQRPKETEVRSKTATYYDTSGGYLWYDWTLQEGDTAKAGKINFSVCLQHIESGLLTVDWNSTIGEIHVKTSYHSDDSDEGDETITPTVAERVAILESMIQRVASGAPIVVASTSDMTDTAQIYVLSTDRNWYYHNGTAWVAGGEYGAVATDTTLTQSGVPADAKAVGDALANVFTGETLADGESMKFVLSSKYDDFKLIDGYGYFDAKKLFIDGAVDLTGESYTNRVYRISPVGNRRIQVLVDFTEPTKIFSSDLPAYKALSWSGTNGLGNYPEGYWYSKDPVRTDLYYTVPKSICGNNTALGSVIFDFLDGSVGVKLKTANIQEYDPSEVISAITSGGSISTVTTEGTDFYKGFLTYTWSNLFDFERTNYVLNRMYNNLGFCGEEYKEYAKECVWLEGTTRIWYRVKADAVSAKTIDAIKDYLVNTRHLKFYYVSDEEVTA